MAKRSRTPVRVEQPFNPLDKRSLGFSVAEAMLAKEPVRLPLHEAFIAAGVYALYYVGDFPLYADVVKHNVDGRFQWPLYVGKAVPKGSRKGGFGLGGSPGNVLLRRIKEHETSIGQVENLRLEDFHCRYLAVEDIWIPLGESLLIEQLLPVWNRVLDGFGIHQPGEGRGQQARSLWDTVHIGRRIALDLPPNPVSLTTITTDVEAFISKHPLNSGS